MSKARLAVLLGTLDPENPLSILRANADVWCEVFRRVDEWYEQHIDRDATAYCSGFIPRVLGGRWTSRGHDSARIKFPPPQGLHVNMMPIKLFQEETIPETCRQYAPMIHACGERIAATYDPADNPNMVVYLTIHESWVPVGQAQRRPGLHVERPGALVSGGHLGEAGDHVQEVLYWGGGDYDELYPVDGIYMASNVADSSRVWPVLIGDSHEVSDAHGSIEHMRERLGPGHNLRANELCWITDRTPHESLPLKAPPKDPNAEAVHRQFFRLVAGPISVWYSKHNTPNPTGLVEPDAEISDVDKFVL